MINRARRAADQVALLREARSVRAGGAVRLAADKCSPRISRRWARTAYSPVILSKLLVRRERSSRSSPCLWPSAIATATA